MTKKDFMANVHKFFEILRDEKLRIFMRYLQADGRAVDNDAKNEHL